MRYIDIIIRLVLCLTLLLFTSCKINAIQPEPVSENLENQEDIDQSIDNSQSSSIEPVIANTETPVIANTEDPNFVSPQNWATGDGTASNPWAGDCIKKAYDAVPVGGTIFLKAGYYQLADNINLSKQINIIGEGRNKTIIKTADTYGFTVLHDNCTFKGFTIDGAAQTAGDFPLINIANCDYITVEDIEAKNGITTGVQPFQSNYSTFKNIYAHGNGEHGMHPCSNVTEKNKYNTYRNIYAWNNDDSGFDDRGIGTGTEQTNNVYDNIQCWDNTQHGIALTHQSGIDLSNSSAWGNGLEGLYIRYIKNSTVSDCLFKLNDDVGVLVSTDSDNINFTNVISMNNNNGITVYSPNIIFTACQSYDDRETPLQNYGIALNANITGISIINCTLTPNEYGDIYNPNGVVINIITENMLDAL